MKAIIQKPKGAKEKFGVNIKIDKKLDENAAKSLFPNKMEKINGFLAGLHSK